MQLHQDSHADDDSLEQYSIGSLAEPDVAQLEEHLLVCSGCQKRLEEIDAYVAAMHGAAAGLQQDDEARRRFWTRVSGVITFRRLAWAMALAALVLVVVAVVLRMSSNPAHVMAPVAVWLTASRGAEVQHAPSGRPLDLTLEISGLPVLASYQAEIVDATGKLLFESRAPASETRVRASIPSGLRPGVYFVRLYSPSRELLREYGLETP